MKKAEELARLDDKELIAACLDGNRDAWETLIVRYQRLIYSIPLKIRLSTDDAADVFQSVCLKMMENLSSLRDHEKLVSWLITTTTRECWRLSARRRRDSSPELGDDESNDRMTEIPDHLPLADEQIVAVEQQQIVRQALAQLPERCGKLLRMLFYRKDELSYADIARQIKIPVASIGPTRARCLDKLKKILDGKL